MKNVVVLYENLFRHICLSKIIPSGGGHIRFISVFIREFGKLDISTVSAIEFRSAIWKKVREKIIPANKAKIVIDFFLNDQDLFNWISLTDNLVTNAAKLIMKYGRDGLRTLDSLQLAAALTLKDDDSLFITYDELLKESMIKEGLILTKNK